MADHGVYESIYIHDPDLMGLKSRDRSPSEWKLNNNKSLHGYQCSKRLELFQIISFSKLQLLHIKMEVSKNQPNPNYCDSL